MSWWTRWRKQQNCFHHDPKGGWSGGEPICQSDIKAALIDLGRRKMFWCTECGKKWFSW